MENMSYQIIKLTVLISWSLLTIYGLWCFSAPTHYAFWWIIGMKLVTVIIQTIVKVNREYDR